MQKVHVARLRLTAATADQSVLAALGAGLSAIVHWVSLGGDIAGEWLVEGYELRDSATEVDIIAGMVPANDTKHWPGLNIQCAANTALTVTPPGSTTVGHCLIGYTIEDLA